MHVMLQNVVSSGKDKKSAPNTAAVGSHGGSSSAKAHPPNSPINPGVSTPAANNVTLSSCSPYARM